MDGTLFELDQSWSLDRNGPEFELGLGYAGVSANIGIWNGTAIT